MKNFWSKGIAVGVMIALISTTFISVAAQQIGTKQKLDVWSGSLKVKYNNSDVTSQIKPIVVNNVTYLPLRTAATLFNKNVLWNATTVTVSITDKTGATTTSDAAIINQLKLEIAAKDAEIAQLNSKIQSLNSAADIDSLESDLNDEYGTYKSTDFKYTLSGNSTSVTIKIDVDKTDFDSNLSTSQKKTFYQLISDFIRDEFKSAAISATVKDGSKTIDTFTASALSGTVKLTGSSADDEELVSDLEDTLNDKLAADKFGKLTDIDNDDLEIKLDGDTDDLTFKIDIDLGDYDSEWKDLDESDIEDFMEAIHDYIADEDDFGDTDITGYFYDTDNKENLVKCYESGSDLEYKYY